MKSSWALIVAVAGLAGCAPSPEPPTVSGTKPEAPVAASAVQKPPAGPSAPAASAPTNATEKGVATEPRKAPTTNEKTPTKPAVEVDVPPSDLFTWAKTREAALVQAKKVGGYVVLKFEADWCVPCQVMKREAFTNADVAAMLKKAVVVTVDADSPTGKELCKQYKVDTIPFLQFLRADGQELGGVIGYQNVDWLKRQIKRVLARA